MPCFSPETNCISTEKDGKKFTAIGIDPRDKSRVLQIAQTLFENGVQMIELCGGFGPEWIAQLSVVLGHEIPVGGVFYGPEYRKQLVDLLS